MKNVYVRPMSMDKSTIPSTDIVYKRVTATVNLNISQWNDDLADYRTDEFHNKSISLMTEVFPFFLEPFYKNNEPRF